MRIRMEVVGSKLHITLIEHLTFGNKRVKELVLKLSSIDGCSLVVDGSQLECLVVLYVNGRKIKLCVCDDEDEARVIFKGVNDILDELNKEFKFIGEDYVDEE